MDSPTHNDAQLVFASRQGNQRAFAALVDRYKGLVAAIAYSSTCDPVLSRDLAQDAFTVAWRKLNEINEPEKFRPWICGVVRHLLQQARRDRNRATRLLLRIREAATRPASSPPTPRDEAVAREQAEIVAKAMAQLPEEYRLPLVLYYYEGRSSRMVAEALGISDEAARQRLARGRQRLRADLMRLVDNTLERQRPKRTFVLAVMAGLIKAPVQGLPAAKMTVSAAALKSLGAVGATVAAALLVFLARVSVSQGSPANVPPSVLPEPPTKVTSSAVPSLPTPHQGAVVPPSVPSSDAGSAEAIALAAQILDRAWVTQPMPAARTLCVEAWGYRAALGDKQRRARLIEEATDPTSGEWGPRSGQMLSGVLYDLDFLETLYPRCANTTLSDRIRFGYFALVHSSAAFLQSQGKPAPDFVADAAAGLVETSGPVPLLMDYLEKYATERARPMAEYYLLASVDGTAPPAPPGLAANGFSRLRRPDDSEPSYYQGICLADRCLGILERVANSASCEVVREYLSRDGRIDTPYAAVVLCRLGDREHGLAILRNLLAQTQDPFEQIRLQSQLIGVGERQYLDSIKLAVESSDPDLRMAAYCALCRHDDPSFIQPAVRDFRLYGNHGFWQILRSSPEILRVTEGGIRTGYNTAFTEYCLALATHPSARNPEDGLSAVMAKTGLSALFDSEQAPRAVGACMPALSTSLRTLENQQMRSTWVHKLVYLIRWGNPEVRQHAAQRLAEACRRPDIEADAVFDLKWAENAEAIPLLEEMMKSSSSEAHRVLAAVAYLAIRSGKRL